MADRPVRLSIATRCTTSSGVILEPGTYPALEEQVVDRSAPGGFARPRFVIDHGLDGRVLDVTGLVESGDIIVVVD